MRRELEYAPVEVSDFFKDIVPLTYLIPFSEEAILLQQSYIEEGVVTNKSFDDALHVALATVLSVT